MPLLMEAVLLILVLLGVGLKHQEFFLTLGNLWAAVGLRLPGLDNSWLLIGPLAALLLMLCFFFGTAALTSTPLSSLPRLLPWLPAILLFAVMNAFGE